MIAVTFALPAESAGLVDFLRDKKHVTHGGTKVIEGRVNHRSIAVLHTGVGRKICGPRMDNFLRVAQPEYVISSGFAGAMRDDFQLGDLVLAENFSDQQLLSTAQQGLRGRTVHTARLFTSATMIDSSAERYELARTHGAAAVDMETEIIARACAARGISLLSLRVISDTPRDTFPAPADVLFDVERQRTNFFKFSLYLLKYPGALPRLIRFTRQIARARQALADALVALLRSEQL